MRLIARSRGADAASPPRLEEMRRLLLDFICARELPALIDNITALDHVTPTRISPHCAY